jgi:SAM-dependent methyltransferase
MNAFTRLSNSLRIHGVSGTTWLALKKIRILASLIEDRWFDYKYNTDTIEIIELDQLDIPSDNKPFGMRYEVTRARPFRKLLHTLQLPRDGVFVDLGSGKGRVLMLAAEYGFRKIIGVEFSSQLNAIAHDNIAVFQEKQHLDSDIEIIESDVVNYEIEPDQIVFFMFNPFYTIIIETLLEKIARSLEKHPRKVWLIYQYPECRPAIDDYGVFKETSRYEWGGCEFIVYENQVL